MGAYPKQPTNYVHFKLAIRFREILVFFLHVPSLFKIKYNFEFRYRPKVSQHFFNPQYSPIL